MAAPAPTKSGRWVGSLPALVFIATMGGTLLATLVTKNSLESAARARIEAWSTSTVDRLHDRLQNAATVARGTAGLFVVESRVSPAAFHAFVQAQDISRWFAEGRVSWVPALQPGEGAVALALGRREWADYAFDRPEPRYPVVFISPPDERNHLALGRDLADNEERRVTIELARDTGEVVLAPQLPMRVEDNRLGTIVFCPIYSGLPTTLDERREQFRGVIIVSTATDALMRASFGPVTPYLDIVVNDGAQELWSSGSAQSADTTTRSFPFGGRTLTVVLRPRDTFLGPTDPSAVLLLITGTLLALALAGLTWQQLLARRRAETEQEATRNALLEAERRRALLDLVVSQTSDGIIMADEHGTLRIFNEAAAELHGVSVVDVAAPNWAATYGLFDQHGAPLPLETTPLFRAVKGELVRDAHWVVRRPDGTERRLAGTASPLRNADGSLAGGVLVTRDETLRQQIEADREQLIAALEFSNAELEQFASVASHDLKAPLRGIAQLAHWLEEDLGVKLSDENRQHLKLLQGRVRRLVALIDGILGYARAGESSQTVHTFEPKAAVAEALALVTPPEDATVVLPNPGLTINGDKPLLVQVLMNLFSNAFKHGRTPGEPLRVEVTAELEGEFVRFQVRDFGPGIAPEYQERVWGMFQTLVPRDEKESTGIGLAVVRKVVRGQSGRTWVESAPGKGATFCFTWPRRPTAQTRAR